MGSELGQSIVVKGIGVYSPSRVLTNDDLAELVDTSDEWIYTRTGMKERRIGEVHETTSMMGVEAAKIAMERAGVAKGDIDLVIVATMTPDMPFPATACVVQAALGLNPVTAFDLQAACSGFVYMMEVADKMMKGSSSYRNALIIGSEKLSSIMDWEDRSTCVLFGDGAGAVVLSKVDEPGYGLMDAILGADGNFVDILHQPGGGSACPATEESVKEKKHYLKMRGPEVFKNAVRSSTQSIASILEKNGLTAEDISLVVPHQANIRIIEAISSRTGIPMDRIVVNLQKYGNTSSASVPLALNEANEEGRLKKGDLILLIAFGAGLTWATTLLRWF